MNKLLLTKESYFDIEEIALYYDNIRRGLSLDFELCLEASLDYITNYPTSFQVRYKQVRICFIERFPYGIHYLYKDNIIKVIGVFHTSRNPTNWVGRSE